MFVRDRSDKPIGEPCERNGPLGHHFSCDLVVGPTSKLVSFRFTCREEDYKYVMDKTYPLDAHGRQRLLDSHFNFDPAITPYTPAVPAFESLPELLMSIKEVNDIATTGAVLPPSPGAARADAAMQAIGVPAARACFAMYL